MICIAARDRAEVYAMDSDSTGESILWSFVRRSAEGVGIGLEKIMTAPQRSVTGIATVGIPVTDQDRALGFYTETLEMEKRLDVPLPQFGGRWITVAPPGSATTIALIPARDGIPAGVETGIRLASPNAAAAHQRLSEQGVDVGELLHWEGVPPMFGFRHPDGNGLEITQEESRS
jgi:catechol 2,3-dioxygenase-like lactoylglutathione lyase family enzyme